MNDTREKLAEYAHGAWCGWMEYIFEKSTMNADGTCVIPSWAVKRWQRQMKTAYAELSEREKASDRKEADTMILVLRGGDEMKRKKRCYLKLVTLLVLYVLTTSLVCERIGNLVGVEMLGSRIAKIVWIITHMIGGAGLVAFTSYLIGKTETNKPDAEE